MEPSAKRPCRHVEGFNKQVSPYKGAGFKLRVANRSDGVRSLAAVTEIDKDCSKVATFNGPIVPGPAPVRLRARFCGVCGGKKKKA